MKKIQELMSAIGRKRAIFLFALLILDGGMLFVWQNLLLPQQEDLTSQQNRLQSGYSQLQTQLKELPAKQVLLHKNDDQYAVLEKQGLFMPQDRIEARTRMQQIRQESGLRNISYKIEPQTEIVKPEVSATNNQLVMSRISVDLHGLTDHEVYNFLDKMQADFKGLVLLKNFSMTKAYEVTPYYLGQLQHGVPTDFVTAQINYEWYNISPKTADKSSPLSQAFEGSTP
jgi:hypothetical protein